MRFGRLPLFRPDRSLIRHSLRPKFSSYLFLQISSGELSRAVFSQTGCLDFNLLTETFVIRLYIHIYVCRWMDGGRFSLFLLFCYVCVPRRISGGAIFESTGLEYFSRSLIQCALFSFKARSTSAPLPQLVPASLPIILFLVLILFLTPSGLSFEG